VNDEYKRNMRRLSELYPELSGIKVDVCKKMAAVTIEAHSFELNPGSSEMQYVSCPNPSCTSRFDITFLIKEAIAKRETLWGEMGCDGKLSAKYLKSQAQTCDRVLIFKITPLFK
jgi:hypothetical protein